MTFLKYFRTNFWFLWAVSVAILIPPATVYQETLIPVLIVLGVIVLLGAAISYRKRFGR